MWFEAQDTDQAGRLHHLDHADCVGPSATTPDQDRLFNPIDLARTQGAA